MLQSLKNIWTYVKANAFVIVLIVFGLFLLLKESLGGLLVRLFKGKERSGDTGGNDETVMDMLSDERRAAHDANPFRVRDEKGIGDK